MGSEWDTMEAFEQDLWSFSEMEGATAQEIEIATPASILEYNAIRDANHTSSIFDPPCPTDDVTYIVSGRGRGGVSTIIRPGAVLKPDPTLTSDVRRRLREVSGMGYSNELIEQSFKAASGSVNGITNSKKILQSVPSTSSSCSSTPNHKPKIQTPVVSNRSSPNISRGKSTPSNVMTSSCSSIESVSFHETDPEPEDVEKLEEASLGCAHPLPLSVILNQARAKAKNEKKPTQDRLSMEDDKVKKNGYGNSERNVGLNAEASEWYPQGNDYWWNHGTAHNETTVETNSWRRNNNSPNRYFTWRKNEERKPFNICSPEDFPSLK